MANLHFLGFPRIGSQRQLKWATEAYWRGEKPLKALRDTGAELRHAHWQMQLEAGASHLTVGDFAWYDQVLEQALSFNVVPERFRRGVTLQGQEQVYAVARGHRDAEGVERAASPMRKWFDTNYHYLAPEWDTDTQPKWQPGDLLDWVEEARRLSPNLKVVLTGPLTFVWLSRFDGITPFEALERLLPVYRDALTDLHSRGVEWVQLDEPALALDLPAEWRHAFERSYHQLVFGRSIKILVSSYFGGLEDNLSLALGLPVDGLHVDLVSAPEQLGVLLDRIGPNKVLSCGVVNGRNIWRSDLETLYQRLIPARDRLSDRFWLSSSCSLLHVPYDSTPETQLPPALQENLAFAAQKVAELKVLNARLSGAPAEQWQAAFADSSRARDAWARLPERHLKDVQDRLDHTGPEQRRRSLPFAERHRLQQASLNLPPLPTTTIGSFPQTEDLRRARRDLRQGNIDRATYDAAIERAIVDNMVIQESLGLDVLVHGEPERNDMVEYFADFLTGFATTQNGWVQSYGTRCVKPPIIFGDVSRHAPLSGKWIKRAAEATTKPVKGMLTGPITMLAWSFPRDDIANSVIADQIALALREELATLEQAGIRVIQVDEPALREKLPLRKQRQQEYLDWATGAFRLATAGVAPETQIHTHMCYSRFEDIIDAIGALDADVATIEAARTDLAVVPRLQEAGYGQDLGPGVYDIHSPLAPSEAQIAARIRQLLTVMPADRLWINPDCGLKTRGWKEVKESLSAMVGAAKVVREELSKTA